MSGEWIKISDQKPPNDCYVLVAVYDSRSNVKMHFIRIASRMNDNWFDDHDGDSILYDENSILYKDRFVTHWMPLPDKPEDIYE